MKFNITILMFLLCLGGQVKLMAQSSSKVVQGTVISKSDNEALIGAAIIEKDAYNRIISTCITDFNGQFVLKVKNSENLLECSFIGFTKQQIPIGNKSTFNIFLEEDKQILEEVSVVAERVHSEGNFVIPVREVPTAVQTFSFADMEGVQPNSVDDALQGQIAGLDIVSNSGDPGASSTMRIRGTTSINAGSEPLIVVNGNIYDVEVDESFDFNNSNQEDFAAMLSINTEDIEEITVLKDGASTAVWGSRGASGVIEIKTKRGVRGPSKVQYSLRMTGTKQPVGIAMLNGDDYTMMMKQAYFNPYQSETAANVRELMYDPNFSEYQNFNNNTDWRNEVIKTGLKQDHYIAVSGGGERARYRVSGGFLDHKGTNIGQDLKRYSARTYMEYVVSERIKFTSEFAFTYTDNYRNYEGLLGIAYKKMPNVSVYQQDIYGNNLDKYYNIRTDSELHSDQKNLKNPVALANLATNRAENYRIIPTFRLQYDLADPSVQTLKYNLVVSLDVNNNKVSKFLPGQVSNVIWNDDAVNLASNSSSENMATTIDNQITWRPSFASEDHALLLHGSAWVRMGNSSAQGLTTTNLPSGEIVDPSALGYITGMSTSLSRYRANAFTVRGHYAFRNRYIVQGSYRVEGTTRFGDDNRYGAFPGVSAKWIISDEPFLYNIFQASPISMFAVRPSWGISGKPPGAEYLHYSRYSVYGKYMDMPGYKPSTTRLSELKWEETSSYNLGVDLWMFDDRLKVDFNYYKKHTTDLLFPNTSLPVSSGFSSFAWQNVGIMDNSGLEFYVQTSNLIKVNDFSLDFNFNLSNTKNILVELRDDVLAGYNGDYTYNNGEYMSRLQENNPFGSVYGFRYKGVYQYDDYVDRGVGSSPYAHDANGQVIMDKDGQPLPMVFNANGASPYEFRGGDAIYEDINNDGSIDELDIVYLGNSNPKFNGGFGANLRYKGFGLRAFFNFRYGNDIINAARMDMENMYGVNNQSVAVNYRWRKNGDDTEIPRALYQTGYNWLGSDRFVEDGSFTRFKYLTLSYNVPKRSIEKYGLERLSFTCTVNNLYIWTSYTGVDPEVGYGSLGISKDNAQTPRSKDITFGLSVTF